MRHGCFCAHPYLLRLLDLTPRRSTVSPRRDRGDRREIPGAVRASAGLSTSPADVDRFLAAFSELAWRKARTRCLCAGSLGRLPAGERAGLGTRLRRAGRAVRARLTAVLRYPTGASRPSSPACRRASLSATCPASCCSIFFGDLSAMGAPRSVQATLPARVRPRRAGRTVHHLIGDRPEQRAARSGRGPAAPTTIAERVVLVGGAQDRLGRPVVHELDLHGHRRVDLVGDRDRFAGDLLADVLDRLRQVGDVAADRRAARNRTRSPAAA